ncbi:hypothetical protein [Cellulomonas composti]|uniref:Uncharacterized protein n=1 Tax=Cellulomonas composti TaxID=266130 RepID=A0A511JCV0_9CELL|nr:hypothetical protein [Cellulomonas composti]GEL95804.1 hypothetical protein CCO02nite_24620 [Cellulomonas composti]
MTHHPDERHPLTSALDDAAASPEARAYEVPVELIRTRARRRRTGRVTVAAGTLAAVVAVGAVVVPRLGTEHVVEPSGVGVCGQTVAELRADDHASGVGPDGSVPRAPVVDPASVVPSAAGTWTLTTVVEMGVATVPPPVEPTAGSTADGGTDDGATTEPVGDPVGWRYGWTVALLRDGVVVAQQEGEGAPDVDDALAMAADFGVDPFPLRSPDVAVDIVACDGEPLAPGSYDLVVTQTTGWTYHSGGTWAARGTSEPVAVVVPDDGGASPAPTPLGEIACGDSDAELRARVAAPQPGPLALEPGDPFAVGDGRQAMAAQGHVVNTSDQNLSYYPNDNSGIVTQDGVVIDDMWAMYDAMGTDLEPGESTTSSFPISKTSCATGEPISGQVEIWLVEHANYRLADGTVGQQELVVGPFPAELVGAPTSETPSPGATVATGQCGTSDDLEALAAAGVDEAPLELVVTPPAPTPTGTLLALDVAIRNRSGAHVESGYSGSAWVFVAKDGQIVARTLAMEDPLVTVDVDAGETAAHPVGAGIQLVRCASTLAEPDAQLPLPAGEYELWLRADFGYPDEFYAVTGPISLVITD